MIVHEQMEELRAKLCGISGGARRLHRNMIDMKEGNVRADLLQLVLAIDELQLLAVQVEEYMEVIWPPDPLQVMRFCPNRARNGPVSVDK